MKITMLLLVTAILQVSATTYAQKITLAEKDASINKVFQEISLQSGYDFIVTKTILKNARPVNLNVKGVELASVLNQIFKDQPLEYEIENKLVFVKVKERSLFGKVVDAMMAKDALGRVFDQYGNPLPGATIRVLGTDLSTTTSAQGYFALPGVKEDATIRVSYIGYISQDIKVSADLYHIKLAVNESKLDEMKVIAYGTTTQRTTTSDVTVISAKDIAAQPVNNILDALAGRVAGLQITPTSGIVGAAPNVLVQGRSSLGLANNVPLFLIDGVPASPTQSISNAGGIDGQKLNLLFGLNPQDVESISVLKDADATAIYGSRGANGVIIITTKRGKVNGIQANLNASTGFEKVAHFADYLDVHQYDAMRREAFKNDGITPSADPTAQGYAPDLFQEAGYDTTKAHNWQKEFIGKTAVFQDLNFSLSGGSQTTHFYLNAGLHREGTVMPGDNVSNRKSFAFRADHVSPDKKFNLNVQANYSTTSINSLPVSTESDINFAPSYQLYNADGTPNWNGDAGFPLANTLKKYSVPTQNFGGSANASYEFIPGLKAKINTGFNVSYLSMTLEEPAISKNPANSPVSSLALENDQNNNWIAEPQLEYIHNFGKHHLELLAGATYQKTDSKSLNITGNNFPNDALLGNIGSADPSTILIQSNDIPYAYNAIFGRATYNYDQKYLVSLTFRRDGSSRFGPDKKFGNFGALGLGWVFTQEKAIADALPFLSFGKIRVTYGITGNDQIGDSGVYLSKVSSATYDGGYNGPVLNPVNPPNNDLQWEVDKKLEAGLELGLFKDRIFLTATYFRNRTNKELIQYPLSTQSGFYSYAANSPAVVQNQGLELELTSHNLQGNLTWNTSFNLTKSNNKLLSYPNFANSYYAYQYAIGQSLNLIKAYKLTGLDKNGKPVFADVNGDGRVDQNDRVIVGNNDPFYGGIKNDFGYKGFNFSFFIQYNRNRGTIAYLPNNAAGRRNYNVTTYSMGRWQNPGDEANTIIPAFTTGYQNYTYPSSDQLVTTRNIFRLSNASLSYVIPTDIVKNLKMSRLQVYVNGQNLYVWDKYKAYELDPQTGSVGLPPLRTIVFGINATF